MYTSAPLALAVAVLLPVVSAATPTQTPGPVFTIDGRPYTTDAYGCTQLINCAAYRGSLDTSCPENSGYVQPTTCRQTGAVSTGAVNSTSKVPTTTPMATPSMPVFHDAAVRNGQAQGLLAAAVAVAAVAVAAVVL